MNWKTPVWDRKSIPLLFLRSLDIKSSIKKRKVVVLTIDGNYMYRVAYNFSWSQRMRCDVRYGVSWQTLQSFFTEAEF